MLWHVFVCCFLLTRKLKETGVAPSALLPGGDWLLPSRTPQTRCRAVL